MKLAGLGVVEEWVRGGGRAEAYMLGFCFLKKRHKKNLVWSVFLLSTCVLWPLGKEKCSHPVGNKPCCSSLPKSKPTKVEVGLHLPVGPFLLCRGPPWPAVQGGTGGSTLGPVHLPQTHHVALSGSPRCIPAGLWDSVTIIGHCFQRMPEWVPHN